MRKTAIVTGASGGIGQAAAVRLAKDGYDVVIAFFSNEAGARETEARCRECGADTLVFRADVAVEQEAKALVQTAFAVFGRVDVLVNNAGFASSGLLTDVSSEAWHRMMGVHLDGAFYLSKEVLPFMIARRTGAIVNVSSMWGQVGASCEVAYSAAKAGLIGFTKALAKETAPSGIRVNAVAPGVVDTAMMAGFSEEEREALAEEIPQGRFAAADEIAASIAFLASEDASYITGQVLAPNGGLVC